MAATCQLRDVGTSISRRRLRFLVPAKPSFLEPFKVLHSRWIRGHLKTRLEVAEATSRASSDTLPSIGFHIPSEEGGNARFADESCSLSGVVGKRRPLPWSDAGVARSDLTPEGVRGSEDPGAIGSRAPETQPGPEGQARGPLKPHGRVDDRVSGVVPRTRAGRNRHPRGPAPRRSSWLSACGSPKLPKANQRGPKTG